MKIDISDELFKVIKAPSNENPFVVIYKGKGIPSAPLSEGEKNNAFYYASCLYPELLNVKGKKACEHGLLHRLDTETDGLLVIAATDEAYEAFNAFQKEGLFVKEYKAVCNKVNVELYKDKGLEAFPPVSEQVAYTLENTGKYRVESYFRPFGEGRKTVRPVISSSGKAALKKCATKLYTTEITISKEGENYIALCKIREGYRHQVRCHLSWIGYPVKGDSLYNPDCLAKENTVLQFSAVALHFPHPLTKEKLYISLFS
ncbi:MAG: hypothetical protein K6F69_06620 [Treponema sp.]|nr:hypothetical protein [Treponema sp.]